jgi:hypothetical protein
VVNFYIDSKTVMDSLYDSKSDVSNYSAVINDCRHVLAYDLVTSNVRFIRRQAKEVVHGLARMALCHISFHIPIRIPSCISTIILNRIH